MTHVLNSLLLISLIAATAKAVEIDAMWQVGSGNWSTDTNWDCVCVPCNDKFVEYNVTIPPGAGVVTFSIANCEIKRLTLGAGSTLRLMPGSSLTVLEDAAIGGLIDACGGDFTAIHPTLVSFSGNQSRVLAKDGSMVQIAANAYSSAGMPFNATIMSADGVGTLLDLSSLKSISTAFNDNSTFVRAHTITATAGGTIDLSGVVTIDPPVQGTDFANFNLGDPDSLIHLTSLHEIIGSGGYTRFLLSGGATQTLPAVEILSDVVFQLSGGAQLLINGPMPATYSSAGMPFGATIMSADGLNTLLDLSSLTSLSTAFNDNSTFVRTHTIIVTDGGVLDLSSVQTITTPARAEDRCNIIIAGGGATLDLSSLRTVNGGGDLISGVTDGIWRIGDLCEVTADMDINLNDAAARLEAPGSLTLNAKVDLIAAEGAQVAVAGRLCFTHPVESDLDLSAAIVELNGTGTAEEPQWLEVGGVDFDLACGNGGTNFSIGELVIGQPGQPTVVALRENINNENRLGNPEVLYLRGLKGEPSTLQILGGSTLVINDLNVYICDELIRLKDLFGKGDDEIPYDMGFIELGAFPVTGDFDGDGIVGVKDLLFLLGAWGPCGKPVLYCPADLNCDCTVGVVDLLILLGNWG